MATTTLSLNKIHVTNSTSLSLNERFTNITTRSGQVRSAQKRSNSLGRFDNRSNSIEHGSNQRLLQQLQRKHKVQAALKLKRRSLRTVGATGGQPIRRGTVKAIRVGANGKPIRTNSLANVATMKADREISSGRVSLCRANSSSSLAERLGPRRPTVGGAAERVARRRMERQRKRSKGRSRQNLINNYNNNNVTMVREPRRSRSRSRNQNSGRILTNRGRSRSEGRSNNNNNVTNNRRSRSRTRNRITSRYKVLPIKARLGVRPGSQRNINRNNNNNQNYQNSHGDRRNGRNASLTKRGVTTGRIQKGKFYNNTQQNIARAVRGRGQVERPRQRSAILNTANSSNRLRARSRSLRRAQSQRNQGQVGRQKHHVLGLIEKQQRNGRRRGRSQQRYSNSTKRASNNNNKSQNGVQQTLMRQRLSRSRSRSRNALGGRGKNSQGKPENKQQESINKDDLDKELDQYMATTRTENDMNYLLKN